MYFAAVMSKWMVMHVSKSCKHGSIFLIANMATKIATKLSKSYESVLIPNSTYSTLICRLLHNYETIHAVYKNTYSQPKFYTMWESYFENLAVQGWLMLIYIIHRNKKGDYHEPALSLYRWRGPEWSDALIYTDDPQNSTNIRNLHTKQITFLPNFI